MEKYLEDVYYKYNDYEKTGMIFHNKTALKILKEGFFNKEELDEKIIKYESKEFKKEKLENYETLKYDLEFEQPRSMMILLLYIDIVLDSIEDIFFEKIDFEINKIKKIIISIVLYILSLQIYKFSDTSLSKTAKKNLFGRKDFFIGLKELKMVCWDIQQKDFDKFKKLFAFDIDEDVESFKNQELFKKDELLFILSIYEFVEYVLFQIELLYKENCTIQEFSKYQNKKGVKFEEVVYDFLSPCFKKIVHSIYYYPTRDKEAEIDILVQDDEFLMIVECKSGTIDLRKTLNDNQIKKVIDNKVKKAYKTLENANKYILNNDIYKFSNQDDTIEGNSKDIEVICIHLSMYPINSLSSNIHALDENYIKESTNPKLTISFEHFLAILSDCYSREVSINEYFKRRKNFVLEHPQIKCDNNEIDLYYQIMNICQKSMLSEFIEKRSFDLFNKNVQTITTFTDGFGEEFRPSYNMIKQLDTALLISMLQAPKSQTGLNKKYISSLKKFFQK